ncbi:MAG: hypothetical protein WC455_21525 [Dehalococcoidia bacterium]|jgi:hypothetical protein
MICAKKTSDVRPKRLECEDSGELRVLLCGKTITVEVLPILVDEDGCIVLSTT